MFVSFQREGILPKIKTLNGTSLPKVTESIEVSQEQKLKTQKNTQLTQIQILPRIIKIVALSIQKQIFILSNE